MTDPFEHVALEDEAGRRLDQLLAERFEVSRSQVEKHIDAGAVTVDGAPPSRGKRTLIQPGMRIHYVPPPPEPLDIEAEAIPLDILFEDEHLLVINKQAQIVVHPGEGHRQGTLLSGLLHHLGKLPATDPVRPGVVHRLDRGTTGVMVFAKTVTTHAQLVESFKARQVEKTYLALTQGVPKPLEGTFDTFYGRHPQHRQRFSSRVPEGKRAITHYEVLETYPGAASVEIQLQTGRTHQIRVHFADAGHPLVGDEVYSRRRVIRDPIAKAACDRLDRPALHAWVLGFKHPMSGQSLSFTAPMPEDLVRLVEALREVSELRQQGP